MGGLSIWHVLIVGLLFVLLFGKGKVSDLMGDVAKGIKSFKKGLAEDDDEPSRPAASPPPPVVDHRPQENAAAPSSTKDEAGKS